ncbi:MAG: hypothetical protein ACK6BG_13050, partial [Cyanobacteriota bacterium]
RSDGVPQQVLLWRAAPEPALAALLAPGVELRTAEGTRAGQLTSCLALDGPMRVGLAMVRRQALESATLWAVAGEDSVPLELSRPEAFVDPPTPPPSGLGRRSGSP